MHLILCSAQHDPIVSSLFATRLSHLTKASATYSFAFKQIRSELNTETQFSNKNIPKVTEY